MASGDGGPWLHAWSEPLAGLSALSQCVRLVDLYGTGEFHLVVADGATRRLRVYRNTALLSETALLEEPTAVAHFYASTSEPRVPSLAVAAGPHVYVYRSLRPYFKLTLPATEVAPAEQSVWERLRSGACDAAAAWGEIAELAGARVRLTALARDFLAAAEPGARDAFAASWRERGEPVRQLTVATCMETLCHSTVGPRDPSCLVIGTEAAQLVITDTTGTRVERVVSLPSVPAFIATTGSYAVDYRIVVACRDGKIYSVKKGRVMGHVIELEAQACGLALVDRFIVVACTDSTVHSFHVKGKKNWTLYEPHPVVALEPVVQSSVHSTEGVLVALASGEIRLYRGRVLVASVSPTPGGGDTVTALRFGPYGREGASMAIVTRSGALAVKILSRHARLDGAAAQQPGPPPEQDTPLPVPPKTRLYLEQCQRERDQPAEMHRAFQRDLATLRLSTARAYVKTVTEGIGPMAAAKGCTVRLDAAVRGLGPRYVLRMRLRNTGRQVVSDLPVVVCFDAAAYAVEPATFTVPALVPGRPYARDVRVTLLDRQAGASAPLRVLVCSETSTVPAISAVVNMPVCEVEGGGDAVAVGG